MEDRAEYKTGVSEIEDSTINALAMLGNEYNDQPAAIIDPPRTVRALREKGLVEYQVWGWVKTSAKFRAHIKLMRGAKHDIWHYLALGVDERGQCKETIKQICEGTGYSHTEVINTLRELDEMGYLSTTKNSKGNTYTPEFVARGENKPTENVVKKVESSPLYQVESSPPIENSTPSISRVKRESILSPNDLEQVNAKVDYILANNDNSKSWQGREIIRADLLDYADWYNSTTGQAMSKRSQKSWWKALGDWKSEGLTISDLQEAYTARSKWRVVTDPNELTKDAAAIHALPSASQPVNTSREHPL